VQVVGDEENRTLPCEALKVEHDCLLTWCKEHHALSAPGPTHPS